MSATEETSWSQALSTTEEVLSLVKREWMAGLHELPPQGSVHPNFGSRRLTRLEAPLQKQIEQWAQIVAGHRRLSRILAVITYECYSCVTELGGIRLPTWSTSACRESMRQFALYASAEQMHQHDPVLFDFLLQQAGGGAQSRLVMSPAVRLRCALVASLEQAYHTPPLQLTGQALTPEAKSARIDSLLKKIDQQIPG